MNIKKSSSGTVVKPLKGYYSFLPNPLPPKIEWDNDLITALSQADHTLGKLALEGSKLSNPYLFMRSFVTREAILSSKIEGTQTTLGELFAHEVGIPVDQNSNDLQEVQNYILALDYGLHRLADFPLSLRIIKEIHEKLMQGVRGSHATPEEFRRSKNWIGPAGCTLMNAKYVPPAPDALHDTLGEFELFLHDRTLPPLIHIALCHYQFEAIHPFLDGNGRMGRLLITLLLVQENMLPSPLLYLSAFFEATRNEYYQHLYNISAHGSWNAWLSYFLNGVALQAQDVLSRAERINSLINAWQLLVKDSPIATLIIKRFTSNPLLTTKHIAENLNIAFSTAQRAINILENLGIISQTVQRARNRIYCAKQILEILEEPTKIQQNDSEK